MVDPIAILLRRAEKIPRGKLHKQNFLPGTFADHHKLLAIFEKILLIPNQMFFCNERDKHLFLACKLIDPRYPINWGFPLFFF